MPKILENRLFEEFKDKQSFTREELFQFYSYFEPDLKDGTFAWRIHDLIKRDIIKPLKRGVYVISLKSKFKTEISPHLLNIVKLLSEKFDEVRYSIWETSWLNEFVQHQTSKSTLFIETEKGFEETFFYLIKDNSHRDVFLNPDKRTIDLYLAESNQPVVIKKLVTRAPLIKRTENEIRYYIPTLEKILVDLFVEKRLYFYLQGGELGHIYINALSKYTINFTRMFSYAKRREKEHDLRQFMTRHMYHLVKDILIDD
ncbi:MAG: hypothetical protein Kow00127_13540 [Bacteroidales bacterium]